MKRRRPLSILTAGAFVAASSFMILPAAATAAPEDHEDARESVDEVLAPTVNDALFETSELLEKAGLLGGHSELAPLIADSALTDDGAWELVYFSGDPRADEVLKVIDSMQGAAPMEVRAVPTQSDPVAMNALAERLSAGTADDLKLLGVPAVTSVRVDAARGVLVVGIPGSEAPEPTVVEGYAVEFEGDAFVQTQSRDWDWAPWTGGAQLRNTSTLGAAQCTAGFNWSRWADGERMGSTAEHCYSPSTQSWRYNHGNPVGQRYYYNVARDTFFMRSYGAASQFSPNVFVGGNATNTIRTVVGNVATPPVNGAVALSGGSTGLHTGTILQNNLWFGGVGPVTQVKGTFCRGGDSGGPWLATNSAGNVIAYGQHYGATTNSAGTAVYSCLFMPVTPISATMQATIMTG